jgi:hypothetical protein
VKCAVVGVYGGGMFDGVVVGGRWVVAGGRWGSGGVVCMVVGGGGDGGLVCGVVGGVVGGVSAVVRNFLLPSVAPDVLGLAIVPARYCFHLVIRFSKCF